MSSAFAQRLNRFRQELDRELPLPKRLEEEYRRLTGGSAASPSQQQRRSDERAANVDQARASAAAVVVISDSEAEDDDRPPDDSGFASAAWERTCLEKPRPAALDSVAARPEWQERLSAGHCHATNPSTSPASRAQAPDAESRPPRTTWQLFDAGDEQQQPSVGPGPSTSSPSRLARSSASEPGSAHLELNSVPGPVISAAQEVARRREATKTAVLNSTARRHPFALGSGYEDISDTSLAASGSGGRMAMGSRPDGDAQQDGAGEAMRALMPRRRVAAAAPAPAVTPPRFRTDFADLTALTTPGAGEDSDYSETDDEDGQEQPKRQRRGGSPSAPAGDKANRRDQGQHAAAAPRQALALGPKTTTTTAAAGQAAAPMNAAGPSTIAAAPRQSRVLHPSSDPPEAVCMQESMTASESETDDEVAGVSGAAGSKVTNGDNARPRARNTTFSSSTAAPPRPQKRPASAFNSGPRQPRGSAATAAMSSMAAPSSSTFAGSSSLAADLAREQSALSTRKTLAGTAHVDRLREREKRVGSRERGLARAQGGQQQQQQQQQVGPSAPVVGRGGHDAARTDTLAAASRPPPPSSNNSAILDASTSRASARGLPPPSGPALTTTKSRKRVPEKMPPWPGYAACVRQWSRWMDDEHRINPQQKAGPEGQTFAGLRILLVASPGLEAAAAAADNADESDSEEEERTGRGSRNGGWSKDMEQWVRRVWDNGGRCVRKYVEGETTHLVAIGVKKQQVPDARTCVEVMGLDPMEGLAALRGVKKVTLDWARESIRQGRVLDEDDPRWKLV